MHVFPSMNSLPNFMVNESNDALIRNTKLNLLKPLFCKKKTVSLRFHGLFLFANITKIKYLATS